jgi:hypothetical protein
MLDDDALSEDYDEDPYFMDFDESHRWLKNFDKDNLEEEKVAVGEEEAEEAAANKYGLKLDNGNSAVAGGE